MNSEQNNQCKYTPTVFAAKEFNALADAATLHKAMRGLGTDEKAIINVLCQRDILQRLEIAKAFKSKYGKDLVKEIKGELSGYLVNVIIALMTPLPYLYAKDLHAAVSGLGSDEETLVEILCTSNYGIRTICAYYEQLYGKTIEFDFKNDTSGHFKAFCISLCKANRDETQAADEDSATVDAEALAGIEEGHWSNDNYVFTTILTTRSYQQLQMIFDKYAAIKGEDIEETIKKEFFGSMARGMLAIVKCIKSKVGFLAERLYYSMRGLGTNDKILIRVVVSRSEIDLGDIKQAFLDKYGETLVSWIADDTSGDYKKALLAIVK